MSDRINVMIPWLGQEEADSVADAIASGWVAQGPRVARFEEEFAAAMQAPFAVATSSCTTALHLALLVAGIGEGDDVVIPSFSFIARKLRISPSLNVFAAPYSVSLFS